MNNEQLATLAKAYAIAEEAFRDKKDLSGQPYMGHLERVVSDVRKHGHIAYIAALLHDTIEDCPSWTEERLRREFSSMQDGKAIVDIVCILTRDKSKQSYDQYIVSVIASHNYLAAVIKLADLEDNMNTTRINRPLKKKDVKRIQRYHRAWLAIRHVVAEYEKLDASKEETGA